MNDELARNVMNLNKSENAKKNLEAKLTQYEERLRTYDGQVSKEQDLSTLKILSWNEQQIYLVLLNISMLSLCPYFNSNSD